MKITGLIEQIFSQAVALDQSGGLRNTIYVINREIFILNYDHTVLLRFRLRDVEKPFDNPISFRANDYDSDEFYEEDGNIVFVSNQNGYERKKKCRVVDTSPEQMKELFSQYVEEKPEEGVTVPFSKDIISMLDTDLSHIEFTAEEGGTLRLTQRNIYDGSVVEVKQAESLLTDEIPFDIEPIALRTNDFVSLFSFMESLNFTFFPPGEGDYITVRSPNRKVRDLYGIVACCVYDEIIEIKEAK